MALESEIRHPDPAGYVGLSRSIFFGIVIMVGAFLLGPLSLLDIVIPDYPWEILGILVLIIIVESTLTSYRLDKAGRQEHRLIYRISEIIVMTVFVRLLTWVLSGNFPDGSDLRSWLVNPAGIIDFHFVVFLLFSLLAWNRSIFFAGIFSRLDRRVKEAADYAEVSKSSHDSDSYFPHPFDSRSLVREFYRGWIFGGIVLVIAAALATVPISQINQEGFNLIELRNITRLHMRPEVMLALIAYFTAGFWLASQARLLSSQARWFMEGIAQSPVLTRRWGRLSLGIILLAAFAASFLPIGSTLAISRIIQIIIAGIVGFFGAISALAAYLFVTVVGRLIGDANFDDPEPFVGSEGISEIPELTLPSTELPQMLLGISFWIVVISVALLSFWFFVQQRGIRLKSLDLAGSLSAFLMWIRNRISPAIEGIKSITSDVRNRLASSAIIETSGDRTSFIRLRNLSSRAQVRFFYLSTVKRAGDSGIKRIADRTPNEYSEEVKEQVPEVSADMDQMTEDFIKARYSQGDFSRTELNEARSTWKRLRQIFKKRKANKRGAR